MKRERTNPPLLRLSEVAKELGIGRTTAYQWAKEGLLPTVELARGTFVPRAALDRWLGKLSKEAFSKVASGE